MYFNPLATRGLNRELLLDDYAKIEDIDECEKLSSSILHEFKKTQLTGKSNLRRVLFNVYGAQFMLAGLMYFCEIFVQLASGYSLSKLLSWFQTQNPDSKIGYLLCAALSLASFFHGMLHHVEFFFSMRTGMRVRVGLIAAIYQKCLSLSLSNTSSTGLILNIVSNDVQKFEDAAPFIHFIWLVPIQMIAIMFLIYLEIGYVFVAPMLGLLCLVPIQGMFAKRFGSLRKNVVAFRDDRIKSISDMLSGIMIVKVLCVLTSFMPGKCHSWTKSMVSGNQSWELYGLRILSKQSTNRFSFLREHS